MKRKKQAGEIASPPEKKLNHLTDQGNLEWFALNYPQHLLDFATNTNEISLEMIDFIFQNVNPEVRDHFYNSLPRLMERATQIKNQNMRFFIWLIDFPFSAQAQCTSPIGYKQMLSLVGIETYRSLIATLPWLMKAYSVMLKLFNNGNHSISISILRYCAESDIEKALCINMSNPKFDINESHEALSRHRFQVMMLCLLLPKLEASEKEIKAQTSASELCGNSLSSSSDVVSTVSSSSSSPLSASQSSSGYSQNPNQFFSLCPQPLPPITSKESEKPFISFKNSGD